MYSFKLLLANDEGGKQPLIAECSKRVFCINKNRGPINVNHKRKLCKHCVSLTLREERSLRVFENGVLSGIFGRKGDEVTGEWRKLHNQDLHDLYSSPTVVWVIKSRRMRWAGHVARMR